MNLAICYGKLCAALQTVNSLGVEGRMSLILP